MQSDGLRRTSIGLKIALDLFANMSDSMNIDYVRRSPTESKKGPTESDKGPSDLYKNKCYESDRNRMQSDRTQRNRKMGQNTKMQSPTTVQQTSVGVRQSPTVRLGSPIKFKNCQNSPNQGHSDFEKSVADSIFFMAVRQKRKMVRQLSRTLFSPTESNRTPIGLVLVRSDSDGLRRSQKGVKVALDCCWTPSESDRSPSESESGPSDVRQSPSDRIVDLGRV